MEIKRFVAHPTSIAPLQEWIRTRLTSLPQKLTRRIELVAEEATLNLIQHGVLAEIEVRLYPQASAWVLELRDGGIPFDPRQTLPVNRDIGGWGLKLMQGFTSGMDYRREGDQNILTLTFQTA